MKIKLLFSIATLAFLSSCGLKQKNADVVYNNLQYYDVHTSELKSGAIAVVNNKIVAIGAEREILNEYSATIKKDLEGGICYPGFIDAHSHFMGYAKGFLSVDLAGTKTKQACLDKIQAFANAHPDAEWITGRGWDHSLWGKDFPNKEDLDVLNIDKPIYLKRVDGHSAWLNSLAIEATNPQQFYGQEGYFAIKNGEEFTGIVKEKYLKSIDLMVPKHSDEVILEALKRAEKLIFASGLTAVTDAGLYKSDLELLNTAYNKNLLSIPVYAMANPVDETLNWLESKPQLNDKISVSSVKLYGDGSLGSRSACLKHPYHDDPNNFGLMTTNPEAVKALAERCYKNNWQLNTHCIGDSAAKVVMNAYADVLKGSNDLRWRIEHAQVIDDKDLKYFKNYNIIPSVQPTHATSDMRWAEDRLSENRIARAYNFKDLLATNGIIALGTDFPVEDISPLKTYYSSVYRQAPFTNTPENGFLKESALSADETIKGMTLYAAIANRWEDKFGSLDTGKVCNITVLNGILNNKAWQNPSIEYTIVDGNIVYER